MYKIDPLLTELAEEIKKHAELTHHKFSEEANLSYGATIRMRTWVEKGPFFKWNPSVDIIRRLERFLYKDGKGIKNKSSPLIDDFIQGLISDFKKYDHLSSFDLSQLGSVDMATISNIRTHIKRGTLEKWNPRATTIRKLEDLLEENKDV